MDRTKMLCAGFSVVECSTLFMTPTCLGNPKCISSIQPQICIQIQKLRCDIAPTASIQVCLNQPLTSLSVTGEEECEWPA